MKRVLAAIIVACLVAATMSVQATSHHGIERGVLINNSVGPAKLFEAFDAVTMAAVDLDGDGIKEIMAHNDNNRFYVFDGASGDLIAELQTRHPDGWGARQLTGPAVGDIDGNGLLNIVLTNSAGWVTAFEARPGPPLTFHKLWETYLDPPANGQEGMDGPAFLADTNNNGKLAIFAQLDDTPGHFKLGNHGGILWQAANGDGNAGPLVGDVTNDGRMEAIYPSDGGQVWIYDAQDLWVRCVFDARNHGTWPASISVSPTLADITGDGRQEIIFGARNIADDRSDDDWIHRSHAHFFAVDADCKLVWHLNPGWANPHLHMHPAPADITGNGVLDIVFQDWNTVGHKPGNWDHTGASNLFAVNGQTGDLLWRKEIPNYWSNKNLAIADVTGNGEVNIIYNEVRHGDGLGLRTLAGEGRGFITVPNGWVVSKGPLVDDLNGDGRLQIVLPLHKNADYCDRNLDVGCREGALQIYNTPSRAKPVYSNNHILNAGQAAAPSDPVPPSGDFEPTFATVKGNEWWIETDVRSSHGIAAVQVRLDGGAWKSLNLQDWGSWARSLHAPAGTTLQFQATAHDGATALSECYRWTDATKTSCPSGTQPPENGATTFANPRGNEWWVEVSAGGADGVDARIDGGGWQALSRTDWGSWARSIHAPEGSTVQFRAHTGGTSVLSDCYQWTAADTTTCDDGGSIEFVNVRGNEWWVEAEVRASATIASVDVRVNAGSWRQLDPTDWGSWARSMPAPDGSTVEFRASTQDGVTNHSQGYAWPPR